MCQAYRQQYGFDAICAMPTNLYGPGDNFHLQNSHVVPALIRRFSEARDAGFSSVEVWGTGKPLRDILHVDDLAIALLVLMERYSDSRIINVGSGDEYSIAQLARTIAEVVGFEGDIGFDVSKPDGTPRKLLESSRMKSLGWTPRISLQQGLKEAYRAYHVRADSLGLPG